MLLFIETYKLKSLSMKNLIEYLDCMASKMVILQQKH